jgi:hypothetical protein
MGMIMPGLPEPELFTDDRLGARGWDQPESPGGRYRRGRRGVGGRRERTPAAGGDEVLGFCRSALGEYACAAAVGVPFKEIASLRWPSASSRAIARRTARSEMLALRAIVAADGQHLGPVVPRARVGEREQHEARAFVIDMP